jgi:hypothetical protein
MPTMNTPHAFRTTTHASTFLAAALAALALPACQKDGAHGASARAPASEASAAPPEADAAQQAEGQKLHAAIECLNWMSGNIFEIRDKYLEGVDPKTGASGARKPVMMGLHAIDPCVRDVKKADAVKPAVPALDTASAAYVSALEGFEKTYQEVQGYYAKDEQLDDKGKKAKELHPKLMDAFTTFSAAHKRLSTTVRTLNRQRRQAKLAAREKAEGRNLAVIMDSMMLQAETLVGMATSDGTEVGALDAQIADTGKLVDEVDAYAGAHKDEVRQFGSMSNIRNYDKSFLAASKAVARKLHDKNKPTGSDYENVSNQYNSLVTNYNNH